jgi:GTP cyclohydrolase II
LGLVVVIARSNCSFRLNTFQYTEEQSYTYNKKASVIGLANKIAAYALQDAGMDTVDANLHLGFPEDIRQYGVIPSILKDMKIGSIQLMTNNPRKVDRLTTLGVKVDNTVPMVMKRSNKHNLLYLETKQRRMNSKNFGEMLNGGMLPQAQQANGIVAPTTSLAAIMNLRETELLFLM